MQASAQMKMVNGRVSERAASKAAKVLGREGLTISSFIRNSLDHIANTGEIPESGFPVAREGDSTGRAELRDFVKSLEAKAMPGKRDYAGLGEDELVERMWMERYGY